MYANTFGTWLSQQTGRRGPVGDLARFHMADCNCQSCLNRAERPESIGGVRAELDQHGISTSYHDALNVAVMEWREAIGSGPVIDEQMTCVECGSDRHRLSDPEVTQIGTVRTTTLKAHCGQCGHAWKVALRLEGSSLGGALRLLVYP